MPSEDIVCQAVSNSEQASETPSAPQYDACFGVVSCMGSRSKISVTKNDSSRW